MRLIQEFFSFFDEQVITAYVTFTSGSLGGNLVIGVLNGACSGTFDILFTVDDKIRWRTGTKVFRLTSSSTSDKFK